MVAQLSPSVAEQASTGGAEEKATGPRVLQVLPALDKLIYTVERP